MKTKSTVSGQSLVEFALTIPLILVVVLVFLDIGRAVYYYSALNNAVREGTRYATVNRFSDGATRQVEVQQIVVDFAVSVPVLASDVDVYCDQDFSKSNSNPCESYVTVSAQIEFEPVTFFLAQILGTGNTIEINAESTMQMSPYGKYK